MKITGLRVGYNFIYPTYWRLESINNGPMEDWKINLNSRYFFVAKKISLRLLNGTEIFLHSQRTS